MIRKFKKITLLFCLFLSSKVHNPFVLDDKPQASYKSIQYAQIWLYVLSQMIHYSIQVYRLCDLHSIQMVQLQPYIEFYLYEMIISEDICSTKKLVNCKI